MRNPYMEFQKLIMYSSKVSYDEKSLTNERTDGRTDKPKTLCPPLSLKLAV